MIRPMFFKECEWEIAQLVSQNASTCPRHLWHTKLMTDKGPTLDHWIGKNAIDSCFPYIVVNEFICAQIAADIGLIVPDCQIESINDVMWFISYYIDSEQFTPSKFFNCHNLSDVPLILLFDMWVCNFDRWESNVLIIRSHDNPGTFELAVIDHSHALYANSSQAKLYLDPDENFAFEFCDFLTRQITSDKDWDLALLKIAAIDDKSIESVVNELPIEIKHQIDCSALTSFLSQRRILLPKLLEQCRNRGCFPNWN